MVVGVPVKIPVKIPFPSNIAKWEKRNQWAPNLRSSLALVPLDKLLLPDSDKKQVVISTSTSQRRPGPGDF
jgi:hypothetical protein